jgi:hypothetical protein
MNMKKIGIGLLLGLLALSIFVGLQPEEYTYSRDILINAKPEAIFPYLNNPTLGDQWDPSTP